MVHSQYYLSYPVDQAPNLWQILSTPHSTFHVFEWGTQSMECQSFSHFKIPNSKKLKWGWGFKCGVLRIRHKFRAWPQNLWWILSPLHSGFALHTQDSPIQIHLSVECWVSIISLGPVVILWFNETWDSKICRCGIWLDVHQIMEIWVTL